VDTGGGPESVVVAFAVSAIVGVIFGLWPAWRAAMLNTSMRCGTNSRGLLAIGYWLLV
jgi:hypothetical protein